MVVLWLQSEWVDLQILKDALGVEQFKVVTEHDKAILLQRDDRPRKIFADWLYSIQLEVNDEVFLLPVVDEPLLLLAGSV